MTQIKSFNPYLKSIEGSLCSIPTKVKTSLTYVSRFKLKVWLSENQRRLLIVSLSYKIALDKAQKCKLYI